jgi:hypothetical protein
MPCYHRCCRPKGPLRAGISLPGALRDACQLSDVMVTAGTRVPAKGVIGCPPVEECAEMLAELVGLESGTGDCHRGSKEAAARVRSRLARSRRAGYRPLRVGSAQLLLAGRGTSLSFTTGTASAFVPRQQSSARRALSSRPLEAAQSPPNLRTPPPSSARTAHGAKTGTETPPRWHTLPACGCFYITLARSWPAGDAVISVTWPKNFANASAGLGRNTRSDEIPDNAADLASRPDQDCSPSPGHV